MYDFKKVAVVTENCCKYLFFNAKSNQEKIGVYFGHNKKLGGATSQIWKRTLNTMISPLIFCLSGHLGRQKNNYDPLKLIL